MRNNHTIKLNLLKSKACKHAIYNLIEKHALNLQRKRVHIGQKYKNLILIV